VLFFIIIIKIKKKGVKMTCEDRLKVIEKFKELAGYLSPAAEEYDHYYMKAEARGCNMNIVVKIIYDDRISGEEVVEEYNLQDDYYANIISDIEEDTFVIDIMQKREIIKRIRFFGSSVTLGDWSDLEVKDIQWEEI
jgi:hypothetical protein